MAQLSCLQDWQVKDILLELQTVETSSATNQTAWVVHGDVHGKDPSLIRPARIRLPIQLSLPVQPPLLPGSIIAPDMATHPVSWAGHKAELYVSDAEATTTRQTSGISQKLNCLSYGKETTLHVALLLPAPG